MVQIEKISGDAPYLPIAGENAVLPARTRRWHILVFLAPALLDDLEEAEDAAEG